MQRIQGFSLIELMIAMSLGMMAVAAVGSVFIYGSRSYKEDDKVSRMQDELRFAMAQLSQDLEMAGFYAQIRNPLEDIDVDSSATIATDCGPTTNGSASSATNNWVYQERRAAIFTLGNVASGSDAAAEFPCIDAAEFYVPATGNGTDIIALKRLGGSPVASETTNAVYLKTNGVQTTLYRKTSATVEPTSGTIEIYEFKPAVWFIRKYAVLGGPQVPALCRKYLKAGSPPEMDTECLAEGIEDMQVQFGLDNNANGVADQFVEYNSHQSVTTLSRVTAVRVTLLARATNPDVDYLNRKTYTITGTTTRGPFNDKFHRKMLSSIVLLRNPTNLQTPQELPQ